MKILYLWGQGNKREHRLIQNKLNNWIEQGYDITPVNYLEDLQINNPYPPQALDRMWTEINTKLITFYIKIQRLSESHDVLMINNGNVLHPEFLRLLRGTIYTVLVSSDDPVGSDYHSKPYAPSFDHCLVYGTHFDENTIMTDKFKEWDAKRAHRFPLGVRDDQYDPDLTEQDILTKERDIDIVFVGTPWPKERKLIAIKERIPQMQMYGQRYMRTFVKYFLQSHDLRALKMLFVKELEADKLVPLYQRCKIGINVHMVCEVGNMRTYQLPANGVLEICDFTEGVKQVFEVGEEILAYDDVEELAALVNYYLAHDDERKKIAAAGFRRAMKDYKAITTLQGGLEKIKAGMREDGWTHYKDGTMI